MHGVAGSWIAAEWRTVSSRPSSCRAAAVSAGLAAALTLTVPGAAEILPVTAFSTADGLAHEHVRDLLVDSQGFLWLATGGGLSRFDSSRFASWGRADGLGGERIHALLELAPGRLVIGSERGLYLLDLDKVRDPGSKPIAPLALRSGPPPPVHALVGDGDRLWAGGHEGLFELVDPLGRPRASEIPLPGGHRDVRALLVGADEELWIGTTGGLLHLNRGDQAVEPLPGKRGRVNALHRDPDGTIWIGTEIGLFRRAPSGGPASIDEPYPELPRSRIRAIHRDTAGRLWIGAVGGVIRIDDAGLAQFTVDNGLPDETVNAFAEDPAGNLWLATDFGGAARLAADGLIAYTPADGLGHSAVASLSVDRRGAILTLSGSYPIVSRFDGARFQTVTMLAADDGPSASAPWANRVLQTASGEWWRALPDRLERRRPGPVERLAEPADETRFFPGVSQELEAPHLFAARNGEIWVGRGVLQAGALSRWSPHDGRFEELGPESGVPSEGLPHAFAEMANGTAFFGWERGRVLRFRSGRFETIGTLGASVVRALHMDRSGTLWAGTAGDGLWRTQTPLANRPDWHRIAAETMSADVRGITDDAKGRIYVATASGVDRIDASENTLRHATVTDGLPGQETTSIARDGNGDIWVGSWDGVARWPSSPTTTRPPPEVRIDRLRIDGVPHPLPLSGVREIPWLDLPPGHHQIEVGFFALAYEPGEPVRFQYRLTGQDGDWSPPTEQSSVLLADLAAGSYELAVRAVTGAGPSPTPVYARVRIPPPIWRRAWFLAALGAALLAALVAAHRLRVRRLVEIERVRTRIATDLHDDLGASLARISVLAEVGRRRLGDDVVEASRLFSEIGQVARGLVAAAGDIAYAIDPRRGGLTDLVARVRRVAAELLEPSGIHYTVSVENEDGDLESLTLSSEQRRHLLASLKEALHNAVQHADPRRVALSFRAADGSLAVRVTDDGRGFAVDSLDDSPTPAAHHGLVNMRSRLAELGGELEIDTRPEHGTRLTLRVPL